MAVIADYQSLIDGFVKPWVKSSTVFPKAGEAAAAVLKAFEAQKAFLEKATTMKKPSEDALGGLLGPTSEQMGAVGVVHDSNVRDKSAKSTQTVQEGIQGLAWVTTNTPVPFLNDTMSSCMFYGNKVIMEHKGKDDKHMQWIKDFKAILEELQKYCKAHHTTGVAWGSSSGGSSAAADVSASSSGNSVQAYDEFLKTVDALVKASGALSPEVGSAAASLSDAFNTQRAFLAAVETHSKPKSDEVFVGCLQPQVEKMEAVSAACKKIKSRDFDQHSKAIEESAQLIAWVSVPTTVSHVAEQANQVMFYVNKILMQNKGNDAHKNWATAFKAVLEGLQDYVKSEHKSGLGWKAGAPEMTATAAASSAPKAPSANVIKATGGESAQSALFAELSRGTDISKGLKKVDDSQKTHKNRTGEAKPIDEAALEKKKAALAAAAKKRSTFPTGEPKADLEGKKWCIEYQVGTRLESKELELNVERSHSLYIYGCQFMFLKVKGKVNAITIDKCKKVQVMFETCIGSLEITSSEGVEVQVTGTLPAATIDKSKEIMLYLSQESLGCVITSSACTCINVTVPGKTDGDTVEMNVPEQFVSHIQGNKICTVPMDHAG
ncbi:Adenylyl cyclase-associated protein [Diplonema papillatum]|nr:Adenylyl cyclase-associated protein [Diplonema papillatum]